MKLPIPDGDDHPPQTVYVYQAANTRGVLINHIILLERLVDSYIAEYFCGVGNRSIELMDMILATRRITFDGKMQVLKMILDKQFSRELNKHSEYAKDLQLISNRRNQLAHFFLDPSPEAIERFIKTGAFTLLKIDNFREPKIYDFAKVKETGDLADKYINIVTGYLNIQRGKHNQPPMGNPSDLSPDAPSK